MVAVLCLITKHSFAQFDTRKPNIVLILADLLDEHLDIAQRLKQQLAALETDLKENVRPPGVADTGATTGN